MAKAAMSAVATRDITLVTASPLERTQETAQPFAEHFGLPIDTDDRLIETSNFFEGKRVGIGAMRDPRNWWAMRDPFGPTWGERYSLIAERMSAAVESARVRAAGHEALLVSHKVAIWTLRRQLECKRLWHNPRQRHCGLASLTSLHFQGASLVRIGYSEPAAHLVLRRPVPAQ
jgi:broad specificity phosphatase PhoE